MTVHVAALFVDSKGIYSTLDNVDVWDIERDARTYADSYPVVAHPPCNLWGRFAAVNYARWGGEHNRPGNDKGCFRSALDSVNRCGGVLEHPAGSHAWTAHCLSRPVFGMWVISGNGWVTEVWQSAYGHPARKKTWLYLNGAPVPLNWSKVEGTHQIGFHDQRGKDRNKPTISGRKASATPPLFATTLIALAQGCR